jgi:hypothetical protein
LVAALAVALTLDPARRRLASSTLRLLPLALVVIWLAARSHVNDAHVSADVAGRDGRQLAVALVMLTLAQAAVAFRFPPVRGTGVLAVRVLAGAIGLAGVAGLALGTTGIVGDRGSYWRAAWADYQEHPLLGSGPGSFEISWLRHRTLAVAVHDAHNLYLEALAELGPIGLALLVAALSVPIVAATRRRSPLAATASAAYTVFVVHAALDWDWEMPAVTVVALLCGACAVIAGRDEGALVAAPARRLAGCIAASAGLAAAAFVGLIGNRTLAQAASAAASGEWTQAERQARTASRWQPWSSQPYVVLGEAHLGDGDRPAARSAFARALRLDADDWRTWYEVARVGDLDTRRTAVRQIARLNPLVVTTRRVSRNAWARHQSQLEPPHDR